MRFGPLNAILAISLVDLSACQPKVPAPSAVERSTSVDTVSAAPLLSSGYAEDDSATSSAPPLPEEVTAFVSKRDDCDHWRGEDPYDADRAKQIADAENKTCKGSDAALANLRKKYKNDPNVIDALKDYEDKIYPSTK